ncbi:MAG: DUF169 domain-containing protein [Calditrichia bacterium]
MHKMAENIREKSDEMMRILDMTDHPVGVCLVKRKELPDHLGRLQSHRFCQALMQAREGKDVVLEGDQLVCPAAAAAFGFRPLPENLKNGKGLEGYGIVSRAEVGRKMFEQMPRIPAGHLDLLHLFPLQQAQCIPDVVIIEDEIEKLMWISLAAVHARGGARIESSTAVLQATCVDCTIIPFLERKINLSYGCYGCREATNLKACEAALGFPIELLPGIVDHLSHLNKKAIPISREKRPFRNLQKEQMVD